MDKTPRMVIPSNAALPSGITSRWMVQRLGLGGFTRNASARRDGTWPSQRNLQQPRSVHARRNDEIHVTDLARLGGCHNQAALAARRTSFVSTYPQEGQANIKRNPSKKQRMTMTRKEQMMKKQEMMQHNMWSCE
jgi:hypothetical protein